MCRTLRVVTHLKWHVALIAIRQTVPDIINKKPRLRLFVYGPAASNAAWVKWLVCSGDFGAGIVFFGRLDQVFTLDAQPHGNGGSHKY